MLEAVSVLTPVALIVPSSIYAILANAHASYREELLALPHGISVILLILSVFCHVLALKNVDVRFSQDQGPNERVMGFRLSPSSVLTLLLSALVAKVYCAVYLSGSLLVVEYGHTSKSFVICILLPMVGFFGDFVIAIRAASRSRTNSSIALTFLTRNQIALLIAPRLVILGWIIRKPFALDFDAFEAKMVIMAALVNTFVLFKEKPNYFDGGLVIGL
jgi:calcium/proton exchanger cax